MDRKHRKQKKHKNHMRRKKRTQSFVSLVSFASFVSYTFPMRQYLDLLRHVLENGVQREDRTGVGRHGVFGYQLRVDLGEGFPLLTTKKMATKAIVHELLWFLSGDTNIKYLADNDVHIWDEWPFQDYLIANNL